MIASHRLLATAALLALTACGAPPVPPPSSGSPAPDPGACNAAPAQFALGRTVDPALRTEALQRSGARTLRMIRPGDAVTMEFSSQRLNLELDPDGRVTRVRCG